MNETKRKLEKMLELRFYIAQRENVNGEQREDLHTKFLDPILLKKLVSIPIFLIKITHKKFIHLQKDDFLTI